MTMAPRIPVAVSICLQLTLAAFPVASQNREAGPWWPHPIWGAGDQAGASNWITPEKILEALSLVETGRVYELGHVYERGMMLLGERSFAMFLVPTWGPVGEHDLLFNEEFLAAEIGQVGTQLDGLGHVGRRLRMEDGSRADVFYNGVTLEEMQSPHGLRVLGVEGIKPYLTRGILLDVAGAKAVEILPTDYEVALADVRRALAARGLAEDGIRPGDALFFNFGWWRVWDDPERIRRDWSRRPGIGEEVARWIIDRRPSVVGSDFVLDRPPDVVAHHLLTLQNGIPNLEFMTFEGLLADGVHEFLFVLTPLRLKGATGSPGRPLAIR